MAKSFRYPAPCEAWERLPGCELSSGSQYCAKINQQQQATEDRQVLEEMRELILELSSIRAPERVPMMKKMAPNETRAAG
jgi:hypothetical protein